MSRHVVLFYSTKDDLTESLLEFRCLPDRSRWPDLADFGALISRRRQFAGTEHEELIRTTPSPMTVAEIGRDRQAAVAHVDWEDVKDSIMRKAVCDEIQSNIREACAAMLIETREMPR